jgi:phage terminase large subunit
VDGVEKENEGDHKTSVEVAALVARDMAAEGVTEMIADYSIWTNDTNLHTVAESFLDAGIDLIKSVKTRVRGWQLIHDLLKTRDEFGTPYLRIFSTCKYLIREMETIQCDKNNVEDCDSRQSDHALDALRYGLYSDLYERNVVAAPPERAGGAGRSFYSRDPTQSGYWTRKGD